MIKILLIAAGGGLGAVLRYGVTGLVSGWTKDLRWGFFPTGTLLVNILGCFAIGWLAARFLSGGAGGVDGVGGGLNPGVKAALFIGLLGGFTTFSAFGYETLTLFHDGHKGLAALNVVLSNTLGLAACWGGYVLSTPG